MMKKKCLAILFAAAVSASVLAGCGSSGGMMNAADTAAYESAAEAPAAMPEEEYLYDAGYGYDEAAEEAAETQEAPAGENGAESKAGEGTDPQAGRKLITTMNVSAETENFDALMGNLEKQITALGGYIESSEQWNGSTDYYGNRLNQRDASLTIRIPAEKLNSFVAIVEENSNITNKSHNVEDVTLAYVDLESHKKALLTAEERLLELLEKAETVEDLITVEEKLTDIRYQLESMESRLRTYDNKINYSTVYLHIQEVKRLTPAEEPTTWGRIKSGFSENVYNAGQDILDFIVGVIINIPYILIWLVILAAVLLIVFLLARFEKKKKAKRMLARQQMTGSMPQGDREEGKLPRQTAQLGGKLFGKAKKTEEIKQETQASAEEIKRETQAPETNEKKGDA